MQTTQLLAHRTQAEVAEILGISRAAVNKTEQRAMRKLRNVFELEQAWRELGDDGRIDTEGVIRRPGDGSSC